jgi:arylsulfate sulfotransferase
MKQLSVPRILSVFTILALCSLAIGCGSSATSTIPVQASVQGTSNPLVAQMTVSSPCSGQASVQFGPDTNYGRMTASYPISSGPANAAGLQQVQILVAGMRAASTYHMQAQVQCPAGVFTTPDQTFNTGPLPSLPFPTLTVSRPNPSTTSPENSGIEMVTAITSGAPALLTDRDGYPIWYYDPGAGNDPYVFKILPNGHMLMVITVNGVSNLLREMDLAGNTIRDMDISTLDQRMQAAGYDFAPQSYHHDILPLANGHVIVLTNFVVNYTNLPGYPGTTEVLGDGLVDLDSNWNPVWAWNSFDQTEPNGPLDVNRHLNGLPDWTHSNALVYSPADGDILLSMRHQSWILKIDYNNGAGTGKIVSRLGYQGDFALTENGVPTDDPSLWFSFQHFPELISQNYPQSIYGIWDNGDNRPLDTNGDLCSSVLGTGVFCNSRATIFQVDESAMVANLTWADPLAYFGFWGGSINQLENGNVEFDLNDPLNLPDPSVVSQVQEVTQTASPQVVWQMNIGSSFAYRAYRYPSLYPGVSWSY